MNSKAPGKYDIMFGDMPCAVTVYKNDVALTLEYWNKAFQKLVGYSEEEIYSELGLSYRKLIYPPDYDSNLTEVENMVNRGTAEAIEYRLIKKDGTEVWVKDSSQFVKDITGNFVYLCILTNTTDYNRRMVSLRELAEKDSLTGLYNRMTSQELIEEYISGNPDGTGAFIICDIDDFKRINDTCGHLSADTVLIDTAYIMKRAFRSTDIIGRAGGDEIIVFMKDIPNEALAESKVRNALAALNGISDKRNIPVSVSCSAGIAFYPENGKTFSELYIAADKALYKAKNSGKNKMLSDEENLRIGGYKTPHRTDIDSDKHSGAGTLSDYIFNFLFDTPDTKAAINLTLAIIGRQLEICRVYILENDPDGGHVSCTFEWCEEGIEQETALFRKINKATLKPYYDMLFAAGGLFYCKDIEKLPSGLHNLFKSRGIKATLHCSLEEDGVNYGIIGFDECRIKRSWNNEQINILTDAVRIIGVFLLKLRRKEKLRTLEGK